MQSGHREQRRDGRVVVVNPAIREDQEVDSVRDGFVRRREKLGHRLLQTLRAFRDLVENGKSNGFVAGRVDVPKLRHFLVGEDGRLQLDQVRALRLCLEQVLLGTDRGLGRSYNFFTDTIDRRIGDLREELLEVIEQVLRLVRQDSQRRVGAHGADGFHAVARHRDHQQSQVFESVTERLLALEHGLVAGFGKVRWFRQVANLDHVLIEPLTVGMFGGDLVLDLVVGHDAAFLGVDEEHAAGLEAAFVENFLRRDFEHARFGRHDDEVVFGDVIAGRSEAVAVE